MQRLDVIEQILTCTNCELHAQCTAPVALKGPTPARIAIVGEAPGEQEDRQGKPFVGPSGELLAALLVQVGITEDVAVLNSVSCFPHGTPTWDHIRACEQNKWDQIDLIDPTYVLLLGKVALKATRPDLEIKRGRGRPFMHRGRIHFATYHPAAGLRRQSYADSLRDDLAIFQAMIGAPYDDWTDFIPDSCVMCAVEPGWIEETGLGWCPVHMPADVLKRYEARKALLLAELEVARKRSQASLDKAWAAAKERTRKGLAAAEEHADPAWMDLAWAALVEYLETHQTFFTDDLWATGLARPRESRALGPLVLRAAREGLMEKSGQFRKSVASNMTEKPVWTSMIYGRVVTSA